jgi:hypothetical protein
MATTDIGYAILNDCGFGRTLMTHSAKAIHEMARAQSLENGAPVAVWHRDGWATICDVPPDVLPIAPARYGWMLGEIVSAD